MRYRKSTIPFFSSSSMTHPNFKGHRPRSSQFQSSWLAVLCATGCLSIIDSVPLPLQVLRFPPHFALLFRFGFVASDSFCERVCQFHTQQSLPTNAHEYADWYTQYQTQVCIQEVIEVESTATKVGSGSSTSSSPISTDSSSSSSISLSSLFPGMGLGEMAEITDECNELLFLWDALSADQPRCLLDCQYLTAIDFTPNNEGIPKDQQATEKWIQQQEQEGKENGDQGNNKKRRTGEEDEFRQVYRSISHQQADHKHHHHHESGQQQNVGSGMDLTLNQQRRVGLGLIQ